MVYVEWLDARAQGGWVSQGADLDPTKVGSVGFLKADGDYVLLAQSRCSDGDEANLVSIPRGCVTHMVYLTEKTQPQD